MAGPRLNRNDFSRMWLQEFGAGPANAPSYEGYWKAGAPSWALGDKTPVYVPSPDRYGVFDVAGEIIGQRGNPTMSVTAKYLQDTASTLLRLARNGCNHDLQVHIGECQDPRDFNLGWQKVVVLANARPTTYGITDLGALTPDERATVNEDVPFTGDDLYEILRIAFAEQAASQIVQRIVGVVVCDGITCGSCGLPSNGCDVVFAVTLSAGGSPGLPAEVIFTANGGGSYGETNVDTLLPSEDPTGLACIGLNLVVISNGSLSLHYAPIADILAGTEVWTEVGTGFVAAKGPLAIFSGAPQSTWIVGTGGYVYFASDPTAGVTVQNAGIATAQNLNAIHGIDLLNLVAVGASNAVIVTSDGGDTWTPITGPAVGVVLNTVWMQSETEWWIGTAGGKLYYTLNGGDTWTEKTFTGSGAGQVRDIKFSTQAVGWMAHSTAAPVGRILRTIDGGYSWYVAPEGNTNIPDNDYVASLALCEDNPNVIWGGGLAGNAIDGFLVAGRA